MLFTRNTDNFLRMTPSQEGADYDDTGSGSTSGYGDAANGDDMTDEELADDDVGDDIDDEEDLDEADEIEDDIDDDTTSPGLMAY